MHIYAQACTVLEAISVLWSSRGRYLLLWTSKTLSVTKLWSVKTCWSAPCALAVDPLPADLEIPVEKLILRRHSALVPV